MHLDLLRFGIRYSGVGIATMSNVPVYIITKVRKRAKIRNRYNQAPHLIQDTNGKVIRSQLDITNESQEISPFPAGDHKALTNRHANRLSMRLCSSGRHLRLPSIAVSLEVCS